MSKVQANADANNAALILPSVVVPSAASALSTCSLPACAPIKLSAPLLGGDTPSASRLICRAGRVNQDFFYQGGFRAGETGAPGGVLITIKTFSTGSVFCSFIWKALNPSQSVIFQIGGGAPADQPITENTCPIGVSLGCPFGFTFEVCFCVDSHVPLCIALQNKAEPFEIFA
jgi:hypothetical protein